jgi:hypothetical protein
MTETVLTTAPSGSVNVSPFTTPVPRLDYADLRISIVHIPVMGNAVFEHQGEKAITRP